MPGKNKRNTKAGAKLKAENNAKNAQDPQSCLLWPPLEPLVPTAHLALETILEGQVVVVRKLFTTSLCQSYVSFLSGLSLATTPGMPRRGEAMRVNDRFETNDLHFAQALFETTALKSLIEHAELDWGGKVCGLNPRIRVYRYTKGQYFDKHCKFVLLALRLTTARTLAKAVLPASAANLAT